MTNSPHVPFFRPLIGLLEERGHDVRVSARDFAQTLELLDGCRDRARASSGRRTAAQAVPARCGPWARACARCARGPGRSGSTSRSRTPRTSSRSPRARCGVPSSYAYDYEFARAQHTLGSRAATRVVVPDAIPQERLDRLGATAAKVRRYPGLKEEYYLAGFSPDPGVLDALGLDPARVLVVVRTPPEVSLYHRHGNPLFADVLERLGRDPAVQAVVLPRTPAQRDAAPRRRAALARRPGARDRRAEPDRARRPRRLGRRHDEPRGGRARHARLDDVRRHDGRGRRGPDRRRPPGRADRRRRARAREEDGDAAPSSSATPS